MAGLALLVVGADLLVRGASGLAGRFGVPPLVVGLTVVAWGTSAPELAVTAMAARAGSGEIALGNVLGSNIFNVLCVLGAAAAVAPLKVERALVRRDVPLMLAVTLLAAGFAGRGAFTRWQGLLLLGILTGYTAFLVSRTRRAADPVDSTVDGQSALWVLFIRVVGGLVLLVLGARWMVDGASSIARNLGVTESVIGLTVVAAGTSLPEAAASILAAARGNRDLAVGNVVGSNFFNVTGVLGAGASVSSTPLPVVPSVFSFDFPVALAAAIACLPVFSSGFVVSRLEGAFLLLGYGAYIALTVFQAISGRAPVPSTTLALCMGIVAVGFVPWVVQRRP